MGRDGEEKMGCDAAQHTCEPQNKEQQHATLPHLAEKRRIGPFVEGEGKFGGENANGALVALVGESWTVDLRNFPLVGNQRRTHQVRGAIGAILSQRLNRDINGGDGGSIKKELQRSDRGAADIESVGVFGGVGIVGHF